MNLRNLRCSDLCQKNTRPTKIHGEIRNSQRVHYTVTAASKNNRSTNTLYTSSFVFYTNENKRARDILYLKAPLRLFRYVQYVTLLLLDLREYAASNKP
ncbi:hypothetical protein Zmor_004786 [Zophobas morio]|uniref:Uncharacterized protein n=1 Tax=Zophobas morio TaxID=2755281 RepID=A0AA38ISR9_9CUCU|nr:hypothetical protein Zmor_004786 [Zophobas morio]